MSSTPPDYLVIGHVTRDILPGNAWRSGGTVTFSALAAKQLGLRVGVLTSARTCACLEPIAGVAIRCISSQTDTVFENIYSPTGRKQYLRSVASKLTAADLPAGWLQAPIIHLGPVAQELSQLFAGELGDGFVGITPQGWLRTWDDTGHVRPMPLEQAEATLSKAGCVVLSLEDLGGDSSLLDQYAHLAPLLVQTCGKEGAIVYEHGIGKRVPAYQVDEIDPTGAGDVFATAFFIRYYETRDPIAAARFANCVASFVVEGPGTSTIPGRDQVEDRLRYGKLRCEGV